MQYTTHEYKGVTFYTDIDNYCTVKVDHDKCEFITLANLKHSMALHKFHRYIAELLSIECYHDTTMEDYVRRTSDKKLKTQGLKRI